MQGVNMGSDILITEMFHALIGELTRPSSQSQMVLCPFHPDSTPSMKLDIDQNQAFCYACRKSWTPDQFEKAVRGETDESSIKKNTVADMVDVFEKQILNKIRKSGKNPIQFKKVFTALDLMRDKENLKYDDLQEINLIVDALISI
jgi:hypothetical protein